MKISLEEYEKRKTQFRLDELEKEPVKPDGMIANWGFRLRKDKEFDEKMKEQGIEIE